MKRMILAFLLPALPALAQQPPAPPIAMPQDTLQRISIYLLEGGSHNEGFALNRAIGDAIAIQQTGTRVAELTKERDGLKATADAAAKERDALKVKADAKPADPGPTQ